MLAVRTSLFIIIVACFFITPTLRGQEEFSVHYLVDSSRQLTLDDVLSQSFQNTFDQQLVENSNFGFDKSAYWFRIKLNDPKNEPLILEIIQNSLDSVTLYQKAGIEWKSKTLGHLFNPKEKEFGGVNYAFELLPDAQKHYIYVRVKTSGTVAVPISISSKSAYSKFNIKMTLFLGVFFGLMLVMAIYNLLLYTYLRDRAYILYVGATIFGLATSLVLNGYGYLFLWPENPHIDDHIYLTFAGLSIVCSSRFAATFLNLKRFDPKMDKLLWVVAGAGLLMSFLSLFYNAQQLLLYGRVLVLFSFPTYIYIGIRTYRRGYGIALYYVIAWIPYILGLILVTLRGAGLVPELVVTAYGIEVGGASEAVLFSLALAARIKGMRKQLIEKELEKEQFKTKLLSEQKELLEKTVEERTFELQEANQTKDKFFSIIAHDLRSPLIGLQGIGQKMDYYLKKNKMEKLMEMGGQIDTSVDHINHLLNNLLNWASKEAGQIPYNPAPIDLKELVEENIKLYQSLAKSKEVKIERELDEVTANIDLNTISTVIRNLLSNAIKFSPSGEKIKISLKLEAGHAELCFSDKGPGISADVQKKLTSEKLSASKKGTGGEKGFGLGLKLCNEFVRLNKGSFIIQSVPNGGTEIYVRLPMV